MSIALEVIPMGEVAAFGRSWQNRGRRLVTAIVKATFQIQPDGTLRTCAPEPIAREERHFRNNPVASLLRGSDLALLVPKPEILVVGSAYAAPGQPIQQTTVRLSLLREGQLVINKRLNVLGDRRAAPGEPAPLPQPFQEMPILYERSLGGIASRENPVGIGMATDHDGLLTLPNIEPAAAGMPGPSGMSAIPSAWPLRQRKRASLSWTDANLSQEVMVPDDFDDAYYQTAPADQQTSGIYAGDVVALVNMHPQIGNLRFALPSLRGTALAQSAKGDRFPFLLRIDTVHVQPSDLKVEIVYRGAIVLQNPAIERLRIAATLEDPAQPAPFPDLSTLSGLVTLHTETEGRSHASTMLIDPEPTRPLGEDLLPPGTPMPDLYSPADTTGPAARGFSGTMVMEPEPPPAASPKPASPRPAAGRPATGAAAAVAESKFSGTMVIEQEVAPSSLPFKRAPTPQGGPGVVDREVSATPWDGGPARDAREVSSDLSSTMAVESTIDVPAAPADQTVDLGDLGDLGEADGELVDEPTTQAAGTSEKAEAKKGGDPYQNNPQQTAVPDRPPAAPALPRADVVANLYKRAKR